MRPGIVDPMARLTPSERRTAAAYIADGYAPSWCELAVLTALRSREDLYLTVTLSGGWRIERKGAR